MKYSINLDIDFDTENLVKQYNSLYRNFVENDLPHSSIVSVGSGYLISAKNYDWNANIFEKFLGIQIETVRIFITNPNSYFPIHRDCIAKTTDLREWAINVPLLNYEKGCNQWFDDTDNDFGEEIYYEAAPGFLPSTSNLTVSEESVLDCIKIFRTDVHHNVNNINNDKHRVIISYRPRTHIRWQDIKEILKLND